MEEIGKIWMNGRLIPFADAKVHVLTHALHYSTSIFEGIRCYETSDGPAIFRLSDHNRRFFRSAKLYSMKIPYTEEEIVDATMETVRACGFSECYIRPLAYYGYGEMGLTPTKNKVDVSISCWEWKTGESKAGKATGAKCMISSWLRIDSRFQPMQAKCAANYSNAALARMEALSNGYDEVIMLNSDGNVAECAAENIFVVKDSVIRTPPISSGALNGITRDSIIKISREDGAEIREENFDRNTLYDADEIFVTGTAAEVRSVTRVDRATIGDGRKGPVTKRLQKIFADIVSGKDRRFESWLEYV